LQLTNQDDLAALALRIKFEHEAAAVAVKSSVDHAIKAGQLLLQAKTLVQYGNWLPWLRENCDIAERTAQLYMRSRASVSL
jgi:Protein of unknown function (DUF3102)